MSSKRSVRRAQKACQEFHDALDDAICVQTKMLKRLKGMYEDCGIDGSLAYSQYEDAVDYLESSKDLASHGCKRVICDLDGGGIEVQSGGGK